jgi:hypothetical protein
VDPFSLLARAVFDVGRDLSQRRRRVRVRTHEAMFKASYKHCLMINVVNVGTRPLTITHVWLALDPPIYVENAERSLPRRLEPDEPWETWVAFASPNSSLTSVPREELMRAARVRLSSGHVLKSRRGRDVPAAGAVPGGS